MDGERQGYVPCTEGEKTPPAWVDGTDNDSPLTPRWPAGVDGKFNDGSRKALNYLLYGSSGPEIEQSNRNNPELEDMIAVVSAGMCFLYVGKQEVHDRLLPLVGEVAGLQLFTLYGEEAQDMDLSEERKILSFLEMVEPFKAIGTELTPGYDEGSGKGPAMELENWPLIQVFEDPRPQTPEYRPQTMSSRAALDRAA